MTRSFGGLGLIEPLLTALQKQGLSEPTLIQQKAIPAALENKDILGQSETGTGKTLAYLLPVFQKIDPSRKEMQALILTPTHELAIQIQRQIEQLAQNSGLEISGAPMIGDVNIKRQIEKLKEKPQIIVGSAGRILELIQKKKITAHLIKTIVLDEADRLLDDQHLETVKAVIKTTQRDRQMLLFSATLPQKTLDRAAGIVRAAGVIRVNPDLTVAPEITHVTFTAEQRDKLELLRKLIRAMDPPQALIFINKSREIEMAVEKLQYHGLIVEGIHGGLIKAKRQKWLEDFRRGKLRLLVASDLAARGLDIQGVTHIFSLDIPEDPQVYLHRVGRTGRAGQKGLAVSIADPRELSLLKKIGNALKINFSHQVINHGRIMQCKTRENKSS